MLKRRKFIKKSLALAAGAVVLPPVLFNKIETFGKVELVRPNASPNPKEWKETDINIAWIGHATVLINFYGTIIITDPVLFERVGLYFLGFTYGPSRYTAPALEFDELPKPDLVLLSHAHMDHMDLKTLNELTDKYPNQIDCITAYNTQDVIEDLDWRSLREMDWDQEYDLLGIHFKAIEVRHFGWRYPWERDRSKGFMSNGRSFNAYLMEKNGKKIIFGGDTAFSETFLESGIKDVDIAIMPVGAYQPWRTNHCNPEEALIMASEHLGAKYMIPIHCKTFKQGTEPQDEPLEWLLQSEKNYAVELGVRGIGETFTYTV